MSKLRTGATAAALSISLIAVAYMTVSSLPLQGSGEVYRAGGGVAAPKVVYKIEPAYTDEAREAMIQGPVILYLEITPEGMPQNIRVTVGLDPGLDRNAMEAISQWRFEPGMKNGIPVTVAATIEVNFRLF